MHQVCSCKKQQDANTKVSRRIELLLCGNEMTSNFGVGITVQQHSKTLQLRGTRATIYNCATTPDSSCTGMGNHIIGRLKLFQRQISFTGDVKHLWERAGGSAPFALASGPANNGSTRTGKHESAHFPSHLAHSETNENPAARGIAAPAAANETNLILPLIERKSMPNDNRTIYFLHIHKSAGTLLCATARANKLNVSKSNCNIQTNQRCCGGDDSLEAQQTFARTTHYDLVANERDMYTAMDTSMYRYVIVLRNSQARYFSHWKNMCRAYNDMTTTFHSWWTRQPDNWIVRKICGTRCMNKPKYQLSEEDFTYALERLRLFENIMFTERFQETYQTFARHIGWTVPPPKFPKYDDSTFAYAKDVAMEDTAWDPLMSVLDDVLYEYAVNLYESHQQPPQLSNASRRKIREYLADGPSRACTNECCHEKCSTY
ncbi:hypothetical protein MPSEU_000199900 [Mayamaea pseudoterrestris]|nr:hypothetical protein MPSEU_000199900 [Mayamaea pseudoterrestris]